MKLNSIDNIQVYVYNEEKETFIPKYFHDIVENDIILLSTGKFISEGKSYLSLDLPGGTFEIDIKLKK